MLTMCFDVATGLGRGLRWLVFNVIVIVRLSKAGKAHDHQFDEEQDEDGHEANAFDPRVFSDGTREALIGQSFIGRGQKLQRNVSFDVAVRVVVTQVGCLRV
jgi:hypothetical protein